MATLLYGSEMKFIANQIRWSFMKSHGLETHSRWIISKELYSSFVQRILYDRERRAAWLSLFRFKLSHGDDANISRNGELVLAPLKETARSAALGWTHHRASIVRRARNVKSVGKRLTYLFTMDTVETIG